MKIFTVSQTTHKSHLLTELIKFNRCSCCTFSCPKKPLEEPTQHRTKAV